MSRLNLEDPRIERPIITGLKYGVTQLAGTANAVLDADMGPILFMAPTAARDMTLPAANPSLKGTTFIVQSGAAFAVTVKNASAATVLVVAANGQGVVWCDGVNWYGG